MKVQYRFWRNVMVREECVVEIDVPDDLAKAQYLPDSIAGATIQVKADSLPWERTSASTEKSGYHRIYEEVGDDD